MKRLAALMIFTASTMAMKVGVVDVREIVGKSPETEAISKKLQNEFKSRESELIALDKSINTKAEKLKKDASVMSEAERSKLERELYSLQRDMQRMQAEFRDDTQLRQQEEMQKFLEKVRGKIVDIAKSEKYDLILHAEAAPYVSDQVDITQKVLGKLKG